MSLIGSAAGALTGNVGLYVVGGLVLAGAAAFGTQTWRLHTAETDLAKGRAEWAQKEADLSARALAAEQRERAKEQAWAKAAQELSDATTKKLAAADAAASAAVDSAGRLRDRVQALAAAGRRTCGNPSAASQRAAAGDPIGVLAELQRRSDEAAGIYAAVADARGVRGEACERFVESLRNKTAGQQP